MAKGKKKNKGARSRSRRIALRLGLLGLFVFAIWGTLAGWYVHHPRAWLDETRQSYPAFVTDALFWLGNPVADITDGLGWTGHDAVYEYDEEAPSGSVFFAGAPQRVGLPAPADIRILDRGHFKLGWSDSLRHPVWCAYHVVRDARYEALRKSFTLDRTVPRAPRPDDYLRSGYDRGHMAPNYAIASRYGTESQRLTFMMSNIVPQSPALNRGVWRDVEHRIAELWTARYGEIWVVVGCISKPSDETIAGTGIDIPKSFYQIVIAKEGLDVRALAVHFDQRIGWNAWAARHIVTIDELEKLTGLDFNPNLPAFVQEPLESDLPTRLWPIRARDILKQILIRFQY